MNDPKNMPIDIAEMRNWMAEFIAQAGRSQNSIADEAGIGPSTLSSFLSEKYAGSNEAVARRIYQFRQKVESQAAMQRTLLDSPDYIKTPTGTAIMNALRTAQARRIVVVATGPGMGKTMTAKHFKAAMGKSVWYVELLASDHSKKAVATKVAKAMGMVGADKKSTSQLSDFIIGHAALRDGVIVIDEANHASFAALEEARGWKDQSQCGLALLGNEELYTRIKSAPNQHALGRLKGRVGLWHLQDLPTRADIETYLDHFDIVESDMRRPLVEIGLDPEAGGLRAVQQALEDARLAALADDTTLTAKHVVEALSFRETMQLRGLAA